MGDFNTLGHTIARLSKDYCKDHMRWRFLHKRESEWWEENVLHFQDEDGPINTHLQGEHLTETLASDRSLTCR